MICGKFTSVTIHAYFVPSNIPIFFQLDRQNKKIAELEDTIKKLESLKNIAESQNTELNKKLKENATKIKPTRSFKAQKHDSPKDSPSVSVLLHPYSSFPRFDSFWKVRILK